MKVRMKFRDGSVLTGEKTDQRRICPRCGSWDTRLSTSIGPADRLLAICGVAPMRCRRCRHRFLHSPFWRFKYMVIFGLVILAVLSFVAYRYRPIRRPIRPASLRWSDLESVSGHELDRAVQRDVPR